MPLFRHNDRVIYFANIPVTGGTYIEPDKNFPKATVEDDMALDWIFQKGQLCTDSYKLALEVFCRKYCAWDDGNATAPVV